MRKTITFLLLFITFSSFSQSIIATTEDGRRVILNEDKTWAFIDSEPKSSNTVSKFESCSISEDFEEPEGEKKVQRFLKRGGGTIEDLKKHVSVDNNVSIDKVILLQVAEQIGNGNYVLCVDGKKMAYKRTGTVFSRKGVNPMDGY